MSKTIVTQLISYLYPVTLERKTGVHLPHIDVELYKDNYRISGRKVSYSYGPLHDSIRQALLQHPIVETRVNNVLILGFGSGSVARILQDELGLQCRIAGVEIDSEMLELGQKYFRTDSYQNTKIHRADAADFIQYDTQTYDLIVIDLFIERRVPKAFVKTDFIRQVKQRLNPGALVFLNRINDNIFQQEETSELIKKLVVEWEGDVQVLNFQNGGTDNSVIVYQHPSSAQLAEAETTQLEEVDSLQLV